MAGAEWSNEELVRHMFDAFARNEGLALRGLFAEDAVWRVPGRGVMAGRDSDTWPGSTRVRVGNSNGNGRDVHLPRLGGESAVSA